MNPAPAPVASRIRAAWPWFAAVASGVLLTACFAPWNQAWLCWLALTPLTTAIWFPGQPIAAAGRGLRFPAWTRGFALGYTTGLVFFWAAFYWLTEVTGIGWFILAFYMALYPAVWGAFVSGVANAAPDPADFRRYLRSRWNLWFAFLGASCWTGLEWVRGWMFSGFGWNTLGSSMHANLPFIQVAEWTGVGGLTFLAAFVNLIFVSTVCRFRQEVRSHRVRPHFDFTLTMSAMLGVFALGFHLLQTPVPRGSTVPLHVAAVQANIPQTQKWDPAFEARIFETYQRLTETAIATRPQLLLWPEAATPHGVYADRENFDFVKTLAERAGCNFLFGTLDYDFADNGQPLNAYNSAVLIPKGGGSWETYNKIHLVPFGEFVPFRHSFPLFAWIVGNQVPADFAFGATPGVFHLADPDIRAAPLICFEDTVGRVVREPVLLGAQLLVNITNDGWFGRSAANEQQLAESVFRAVENRRPLVRCANTGVTAFISSRGHVDSVLRNERGSPLVEGILTGVAQVPLQPTLTFYTRNGDLFSEACAAAALAAALAGGGRVFLRRRATPAIIEPAPPQPLEPVS